MKNGEITRAICAVFNTKMHTYEQLLTKANLPSLYNRRWQDIAILMFKVKNNLVPPYIQDLWSNISKDVRNVNSLNVFKHAIRNADFSFLEAGGCRSCHLCNS